jgi:hypothetical protein
MLLVVLYAARAFFFLPAAIAFFSSRRFTGECSMLVIALRKANSSCYSISLTAGALLSTVCSLSSSFV